MTEAKAINAAMLRLSSIARMRYHYDPLGDVFGDGPIHFLVEVGDRFLLAWEDNDMKAMIVNPITRFDLGSLEELGLDEAWTVLHVPAKAANGISYRQIDNAELNDVYVRMERGPVPVTAPSVSMPHIR